MGAAQSWHRLWRRHSLSENRLGVHERWAAVCDGRRLVAGVAKPCPRTHALTLHRRRRGMQPPSRDQQAIHAQHVRGLVPEQARSRLARQAAARGGARAQQPGLERQQLRGQQARRRTQLALLRNIPWSRLIRPPKNAVRKKYRVWKVHSGT